MILLTQGNSLPPFNLMDLRAEACKKAFAQVVVAERYSEGGEVEWLAHTLHTKHNFTHVCIRDPAALRGQVVAHTEEDLIRAARIRALLSLKSGQTVANAVR